MQFGGKLNALSYHYTCRYQGEGGYSHHMILTNSECLYFQNVCFFIAYYSYLKIQFLIILLKVFIILNLTTLIFSIYGRVLQKNPCEINNFNFLFSVFSLFRWFMSHTLTTFKMKFILKFLNLKTYTTTNCLDIVFYLTRLKSV